MNLLATQLNYEKFFRSDKQQRVLKKISESKDPARGKKGSLLLEVYNVRCMIYL